MIQVYGVSFVHHFFATRFIDTILKLKIRTVVSKRQKFDLLMIPRGNQNQNQFICYAEFGLKNKWCLLKISKNYVFEQNLEHQLARVNN